MAFVNHVAIPAVDIDDSTDFYLEWFRGRQIPSPKFGVPVSWVLIDTIEIHVVEHPHERISNGYHFAICIEDADHFEELFRKADRADRFERHEFGHHIVERLDHVVQMYIRDPAGNIVECMFPDMDSLPADIRSDVRLWHQYNAFDTWNNTPPAQDASFADPVSASRARVLRTSSIPG